PVLARRPARPGRSLGGDRARQLRGQLDAGAGLGGPGGTHAECHASRSAGRGRRCRLARGLAARHHARRRRAVGRPLAGAAAAGAALLALAAADRPVYAQPVPVRFRRQDRGVADPAGARAGLSRFDRRDSRPGVRGARLPRDAGDRRKTPLATPRAAFRTMTAGRYRSETSRPPRSTRSAWPRPANPAAPPSTRTPPP